MLPLHQQSFGTDGRQFHRCGALASWMKNVFMWCRRFVDTISCMAVAIHRLISCHVIFIIALFVHSSGSGFRPFGTPPQGFFADGHPPRCHYWSGLHEVQLLCAHCLGKLVVLKNWSWQLFLWEPQGRSCGHAGAGPCR